MGKKLFIAFFILTLGMTLGVIGLVASITWDQYQDTREWEHTEFGGDIKDIPPFLARNYVEADDKDAVKSFQDVENILKAAEEGGLPKESWKQYKKALKRAKKMQKKYGIVAGDVANANRRLALYLDLEKALDAAYKEPDAGTLKELTGQLYGLNLSGASPADEVYFTRLRTVAQDYGNLVEFLSERLPKLGLVENGSLLVDISVDEDASRELDNWITETGLAKFPLVGQLQQAISGNDWALVLRRNDLARQYHAWQSARQALESVQKSEYWAVSSVQTYEQALAMGLNVIVNERMGYIIDPQSPVASISSSGIPLEPDKYVRYGTPVDVTLSEQYVETEPKEPEEPDEKDGKKDKNKDKNKKPEKPKEEEGDNESDGNESDGSSEDNNGSGWGNHDGSGETESGNGESPDIGDIDENADTGPVLAEPQHDEPGW